MLSQQTKATVAFCAIPSLACAILAGLAVTSGEALRTSEIRAGVSVALLITPMIAMSALSVFIAHFHKSILNGIAWAAIVVNGAFLIVFFAGLHASAGVICTAPVCPFASPVMLPVASGVEVEVNVDHSFLTAIYFSMVTFTTLGFGDYQPLPDMRLIAAMEAVVGYAFLGLIVGAAIDLGSRFGSVRKRLHKRQRRAARKVGRPKDVIAMEDSPRPWHQGRDDASGE